MLTFIRHTAVRFGLALTLYASVGVCEVGSVQQVDHAGNSNPAEPDYPVHEAIEKEDLSLLIELLVNGSDPNVRRPCHQWQTFDGVTPLMLACYRGATDMIGVLRLAGADAAAVSRHGRSALHYAAMGVRELGTVLWLIGEGLDTDLADRDGLTPMHLVSYNVHVAMDIADVLVAHGADPGAVAPNGATPILHAAQAGNQDLVQYLIGRGVAVDVPVNGVSAFMLIANHCSLCSLLGELVGAGADPHRVDADGRNAFHWAALCARPGVASCFEEMLDLGVQADVADRQGVTPIMLLFGQGACVELNVLIDAGVNIDARDSQGQTVLERAIRRGDYSAAMILIESGADTDVKTSCGRPLLEFLSRQCEEAKDTWREEECLEVLRELGGTTT